MAARARHRFRGDHHLDPRQMVGQSATALPALPGARLALRGSAFLRFGVVFGNRLLEVLQRKVQLVGVELLRAPAELHPLQLADEVAKALVLVLQALPFGALGGGGVPRASPVPRRASPQHRQGDRRPALRESLSGSGNAADHRPAALGPGGIEGDDLTRLEHLHGAGDAANRPSRRCRRTARCLPTLEATSPSCPDGAHHDDVERLAAVSGSESREHPFLRRGLGDARARGRATEPRRRRRASRSSVRPGAPQGRQGRTAAAGRRARRCCVADHGCSTCPSTSRSCRGGQASTLGNVSSVASAGRSSGAYRCPAPPHGEIAVYSLAARTVAGTPPRPRDAGRVAGQPGQHVLGA